MKSKNSTRFLLILLLSFAQRLCRYTFIKLFTFLMTSDISVFKHFIHQMLRCYSNFSGVYGTMIESFDCLSPSSLQISEAYSLSIYLFNYSECQLSASGWNNCSTGNIKMFIMLHYITEEISEM